LKNKGFDSGLKVRKGRKPYKANNNASSHFTSFSLLVAPQATLCRSERPSEAEAQTGYDTEIRLLLKRQRLDTLMVLAKIKGWWVGVVLGCA